MVNKIPEVEYKELKTQAKRLKEVLMSYLEEFRLLADEQNFPRFLHLWEEYCLADTVDGPELIQILGIVQKSSFATPFGEYAESILPLWKQIQDQKTADAVLRLVMDLQTSNSTLLADLSMDYLKRHYQHDKHFNEKLRIIGLRTRQHFQGALSNYELLTHMEKGKFVFHTGGWGVGEIMDISLLREHVLIEFEGISSIKDISFDNAFKNLIPLSSDHFLARRFGNPDDLEKEAKEDPMAVIYLLLKDLGNKTASEIKDEMCDLVIPDKDWPKWWQSARAKIKKDPKIKSPESSKEPFVLRDQEVSHEERFRLALKGVKNTQGLIQTVYNFTRDFPEILKNAEIKDHIKKLLIEELKAEHKPEELKTALQIQIHFLLQDISLEEFGAATISMIQNLEHAETLLPFIDIIALKKRLLVMIREKREDWRALFFHLLFSIDQSTLRDYIFKELHADEESKSLLKEKLIELLNKVSLFPEAFFWYFQKLADDESIPLNDIEHKRQFLEAFLILLHYIEQDPKYRDLVKKMYQCFTGKRYAVVRSIIQGASVDYLQEFLLIATKCHSLTKQDQKILQSLAEVAQPLLATKKKDEPKDEDIIWTTQEGYKKIQEKIHHIGTVETVDNAKEIEAARALGDLRENSEYKFALERRSRLQAELKMMTRQLNQARILTKNDIAPNEVGVGMIVDLRDSKQNMVTYTILGPWDADTEKNILSFQSKFAQAMIGYKKGDSFEFQGEEYTVTALKSFLG